MLRLKILLLVDARKLLSLNIGNSINNLMKRIQIYLHFKK